MRHQPPRCRRSASRTSCTTRERLQRTCTASSRDSGIGASTGAKNSQRYMGFRGFRVWGLDKGEEFPKVFGVSVFRFLGFGGMGVFLISLICASKPRNQKHTKPSWICSSIGLSIPYSQPLTLDAGRRGVWDAARCWMGKCHPRGRAIYLQTVAWRNPKQSTLNPKQSTWPRCDLVATLNPRQSTLISKQSSPDHEPLNPKP